MYLKAKILSFCTVVGLIGVVQSHGVIAIQTTNVDGANAFAYPLVSSTGVPVPQGTTYRIGTFGTLNGTFAGFMDQQIFDSWVAGTLDTFFTELFNGTFNDPFEFGDGFYDAGGSATGIAVPGGDPLNGADVFTWVENGGETFIFRHTTQVIDETLTGSAVALLFASGTVVVGVDSDVSGFTVDPGPGFAAFAARTLVPAIPEPSTYALMLIGGIGVFFAHRRRRR